MKLYLSPGACSLAPHIVLRELGLDFDSERVDIKTHKTQAGEDYFAINPKGYVPALRLDDGSLLTEIIAILPYLADRKPAAGLLPAATTIDRYRVLEWLGFVSSEIHKQFSPLFNPKTPPEWRDHQLSVLGRRFDYLASQLDGKSYLLGDTFTVADAYLYTVVNWYKFFDIDLGKWPVLKDYQARIMGRASVKDALKAEGLVK